MAGMDYWWFFILMVTFRIVDLLACHLQLMGF